MEYKVDMAQDITLDLLYYAKRRLKEDGKRLDDVAQSTGLSKSTISRLHSNKKNVSAQVLISLLLEADPRMELYLRQIPEIIINKKEKSK